MVMKRFEIIEKLYLSKALLKMAGGGMHPPHLPGSAPDVSKEVAWFTKVQCNNNYPIPVCRKSGVGKLLAQRAALEKMLKPRAAPLGKAKQKKDHHPITWSESRKFWWGDVILN